jgi:glutathionyl-hydroquinone reductase
MDAAVIELFAAHDELEPRLAARRFLVGERLTEADLRLFATLVRFDVAYYGALRCNLRRLVDYPNLWAYTRASTTCPGSPRRSGSTTSSATIGTTTR